MKLVKNKHSLTSTNKKTYCLRSVWDATHVVAIVSDGDFGLVSTTSERRLNVASWLPLNAVQRMLPDWPVLDIL